MFKQFSLSLVAIFLGGLLQNASGHSFGHDVREWTSKDGATIRGTIEDIEDDHVLLKEENGEIFKVSPADLVEKDRLFIEGWRKKKEELDASYQAPGKRAKQEKWDLRFCKVALDISNNCYEKTFKGSMREVDEAVVRIINELNRVWIPEVGIQFEIGNLEVRTEKESDPYQATREPGAQLGIAREINGKHKCDVVFVLCADCAHGGGLGGGRGVWVAWGGDAWDLMHHEFSHAFGTGHGHGWPFELGTMNQAAQGSRYPRERRHTLNYKEVDIIRENSKNLNESGSYSEPVKPYAKFDKIHVKAMKQKSQLSANENMDLFFDPLANDYDLNGDKIVLKGLDKRSVRGAKLIKLQDGRVRYQLKEKFPSYIDYDFFHYTIEDEGGLESKGAVLLIFDKVEELVENGDFSGGKKRWKMSDAEVVENGEAITSIKVDQRALLQPGGEIVQEIELNDRLSKKYVLEATIYSGPERNAEGQEVNPDKDPKVVFGFYKDDWKKVRRATEKDATVEMPFRLDRSRGTVELRFTNEGEFPVRVGHVHLRPVD